MDCFMKNTIKKVQNRVHGLQTYSERLQQNNAKKMLATKIACIILKELHINEIMLK